MKSLGVMKQNRNAGGNNVCKETQFKEYFLQNMNILHNTGNNIPKGTLIYKNGSTQLLGVVESSNSNTTIVKVDTPLPVSTNYIAVTMVKTKSRISWITGAYNINIECAKEYNY